MTIDLELAIKIDLQNRIEVAEMLSHRTTAACKDQHENFQTLQRLPLLRECMNIHAAMGTQQGIANAIYYAFEIGRRYADCQRLTAMMEGK